MPFLPLSTISNLRKELEGTHVEILTWGCDGYEDGIKQWSDSCDEQVGAVVRVRTIDEAAAVVRFAGCHQIPFTTRSGGYSTTGASTIRGGIVLDLCNLRKVHVDPVAEVLTAQGGALWEDIDVAAAQYRLAVVGSTLNHIGVAGATLGGGYGWLTGQFGLAVDNLLWARMILADGSVITTSEEQHPDLFWAIRGAGQSFGVAIELCFRAHKQNHAVFAGTLLFSADKLRGIVHFANQFETLTDGKQGFWFGFTASRLLTECAILVVVFYNGNQKDAERFFSPVFSLEPVVNEAHMIPYDSLNGMLNAVDTMTRRRSLGGFDIILPVDENVGPRKSLRGSNVTLPLDSNLIESIFHEFDGILREFPQARESTLFFELLPNTQVAKVPNNATAFASRGPYYNVSSIFRWHDPHLDERIRSLQTDLVNRIGTIAGIAAQPNYDMSKQGTGVYANYAASDLPNEAIFGNNLPRLRQLKKKYDPHNIFRKWHNIKAFIDAQG
ncbi:hypothetical protein PENANT_c054G10801 [Penicillium antarcticum]|uniref:FAD-binding PCMH-type domain-containing protein n=1 Tax=Penicillium antarcticum TaxID=416450 RepID=A0A1V6PQY0_9EURO|nr:uncharacterized protein N7508_008385 [Penicillium antarcticum]KAJ5293564.1 hypothetical protein N7508_008385 [Penicillium antarcticum]OQD79311.1 hypothetical protein PENANT_c054G10801 [Penicillium antarcticum]